MDKISRFYEIFTILSESKDTITDHEAEYLEIIEAVKSNQNEKGLACQLIPTYLKNFPHLSKKAFDAQLDLAEDEDIYIRKLAVEYIPGFCSVSKHWIPIVVDLLIHMLQTDDSTELSTVHSALMTLINLDAKVTLQGILLQISTSVMDRIRKRAIEFLKMKVIQKDHITKEVEELFLENSKKVFLTVSGQDFINLLQLLLNLNIAKNIPVQNTIVDIIATQLNADVEFGVTSEAIDEFMTFLRHACPLFSQFVSSKKFVFYICKVIFPKLTEIKSLNDGNDLVLGIFKALAEISVFVQKDNNIEECNEIIFNELLNYVPLPPNRESENDPKLFYTHIESLMFSFVQLLKYDDKLLTAIENKSRFKDLKIRLQFLARMTMKQLQESRKFVKMDKTENEKLRSKAVAQVTMINLNALIKDFFRSPLCFKSNISLSWKSKANIYSAVGLKRRSEDSASEYLVNKEKRPGREIYVPPGGKYSSSVTFSSNK